MAVLTAFTFDGVASAPYYDEIEEERERPAGTMFALDGTAHHSRANYVDGHYPRWVGKMLSGTYDSLKAKMDAKTSGTLSGTYGSCTAIIVSMRRMGIPSVVSSGHFEEVSIVFQRTTEWS